MRIIVRYAFIASIILFGQTVSAEAVSISTFPEKVIQGEPIKIVINGLTKLDEVTRVTFEGKSLPSFLYKGEVTALYGFDLNKKPGEYSIKAYLKNGAIVEKTINILEREKIKSPLGIPEKLGGNTKSSQTKLVSTLAQENAVLAGLRTFPKSLWSEKFIFPVTDPVVTDSYGYLRETGDYEITHKGTDFRATQGTKITSTNRGIVRLVRTFRNYGKTIVVDHGQGVMSFYMHLSKIYVNEGELVKSGQLIGLSGMTGYAEKPHLHLTVRINGVSIDPIKFFSLL